MSGRSGTHEPACTAEITSDDCICDPSAILRAPRPLQSDIDGGLASPGALMIPETIEFKFDGGAQTFANHAPLVMHVTESLLAANAVRFVWGDTNSA